MRFLSWIKIVVLAMGFAGTATTAKADRRSGMSIPER